MKTTNYFDVQFKPHYLKEFIIGGIPVPTYTTTQETLILKFEKQESFMSYLLVLITILEDFKVADQTTKVMIYSAVNYLLNMSCRF